MSQDIQVFRENRFPNTQFHGSMEQQWVTDAQLDKMEKLSAEKKNTEYFTELREETNSTPVKDKMARLAQILAQKNLRI